MTCAVVQSGSDFLPHAETHRALPWKLGDFHNYHSGEAILVCGCGSSLSEVVSPERYITIGVNDVGRMFQPDYLVVLNPREQFRGDRFRFVEESRAKAVFTQLNLRIPHPHVVQFRLGKFGGVDFSDPNCLHYTRNSPYLALCLAIHMGAKRIGLIGVDFTDDHFFAKTGQHPLARQFAQIDQEYKRLYDAARRLGVEVFNLSELSRLTGLPKKVLGEFLPKPRQTESLNIVSYSTTPVAGVPAILARCIAFSTHHKCRTVWATNSYANGVEFEGDVEWRTEPAAAEQLLKSADVVILHNGKIEPRHRSLLQGKPVITMAHNYMWNVNPAYVEAGYPGVVVGQYQATLPEFQRWHVVPNPMPLWEPAYQPGEKASVITICYTPSGKHESYPRGHRLYWHSKGYTTTTKVLQNLARKFPLQLEGIGSHQITHVESLAMKRRSHIVIDECVTGSYHRNSLEGLACGCVVVNGVGKLPAIAEVFQRCSCQGNLPFVEGGLENLENVLSQLIERGSEDLLRMGRENRTWMEMHWNFTRQWHEFWEPVLKAARDRAVEAPSSRPLAQDCASRRNGVCTQGMAQRNGASVVVCHGGEERLRHLDATLANLRRCDGVNEVIVSELGTHPWAQDLARRRADKYIFIRSDGPFERARCLNNGTALAEHDLVLWFDNDLIIPRDFLVHAVAELRERQLDYLLPYEAVQYLSASDTQRVMNGTANWSDCKPEKSFRARYVCGGAGLVRKSFVDTYGGLSEVFRGWGGEDGAWWHKVRLLGRVDVLRRRNQYVYHLFHLNSGANGGSQHRDSNPYYANNVTALERMRAVGDPKTYLERFPADSQFASQWKDKRVVFGSDSTEHSDWFSPPGIAQTLTRLIGVQIEHRNVDCPWKSTDLAEADAAVLFGASAVTADSSTPSFSRLWRKAVVICSGPVFSDADLRRLRGVGAVLCGDEATLAALRQSGVDALPIAGVQNSPNATFSIATRIVQPLSMILGGVMPESDAPTATISAQENQPATSQDSTERSTLSDVTILITSFLRTGYLNDCLAGIQKSLPECKVIVVDDSGDASLGRGLDYKFIHLPFDSGLSAKRNAGVGACKTRYLLMGSDDFDFSTAQARAGVERLLRSMDQHPQVDVAGGHHNNHTYEGFLHWVPGSHIKEIRLFSPSDPTATPKSLNESYGIYKVDLIVNYFLARTESIRPFPWDERMKIGGEHGDWFLSLKSAGKTVVWVEGVNINELPRDHRKEHRDYGRYRGRALSLGHRIFLEKRGIKHYFSFDERVPSGLKGRPKTLIAIITCKQNADRVAAQQDTWIPKAVDAGYEVQVFDGERLGVSDDYYSLINKTQAVCKWALAEGYELLLKVDDDCCIRVDQLRAISADYAGIVIVANDLGSTIPPLVPAKPKGTYPHDYASGGAYWLSDKAMRIIADATPNGDWAEDRFVGDTLAGHGIFVQRTPDFAWVTSGRIPMQWAVLTQLPTPALMRKAFC